MNRQTTRAFATGLFVSALLLFGYEQLFKETLTEPKTEVNVVPISEEDYEQLEQQVQYWKSEYENLVSQKHEEKENIEPDADHLIQIEFEIVEGMNSTEISERLAEEAIIDDANDFNEYLEARDLQRYIQMGTYEVNNEMSLGEIAELITKK